MIVRKLAKLMVIGLFAWTSSASSAGLFNYTLQYSGSPIPATTSQSPWITASFAELAANTVQLTVAAPGLVAGQFLQSLYFNVSNIAASSLTFTSVSGPTAAIGLGSNNFAAGGGGFYDIKMTFDARPTVNGSPNPNAFSSTQQAVFNITGPAGLGASSFNSIASPTNSQGNGSSPNGTFVSAAHVRLGGAGQSAFVAPVAAVPEPASYAMLSVGLGLVGCAVRRRRKAQDNAV